MKSSLSTSLIALGAFTLAATTASAQSVTPLPSGFTAYHLSPSGTTVSGEDGTGAAQFVAPWDPALNMTYIPGTMTNIGSFAGRMNFDGSMIAGAFEDPGPMVPAPGFWQRPPHERQATDTGDRVDRLPGRGQDDAAQPHPQRRRTVRRWQSETAEGSSAASASLLGHAALPSHAGDRNAHVQAACLHPQYPAS